MTDEPNGVMRDMRLALKRRDERIEELVGQSLDGAMSDLQLDPTARAIVETHYDRQDWSAEVDPQQQVRQFLADNYGYAAPEPLTPTDLPRADGFATGSQSP